MLRAVLPRAWHGRQPCPVLGTCDVGNLASRRVIQANGGVLEHERRGKLRFWVSADQP